MQPYDACRLIALNLYSFVDNPFTKKAEINWSLLYEMAYMQQRFADDIVELEIEKIDKIILKIENDPESNDDKFRELNLWKKIKNVASNSRRTGSGFTALGDMLAALNLSYDSDTALNIIDKVLELKFRAELHCTIDMAMLRGTFTDYDFNKEFELNNGKFPIKKGKNSFFQFLVNNYPNESEIMAVMGRRNVSWSTVAPTGTVNKLAA